MLHFVPYPKLAEQSRAWQLDERQTRALYKGTWVATEKLHGANMCLCSNGKIIRAAKRRTLLEPEDEFFDYRSALGPLLAKVKRLGDVVDVPHNGTILLYGELIGGSYPHPDVEADTSLQAVQSGVNYSPGLHFFAFDLAVVDSDGECCFLPYAQACKAFAACQIPAVPILSRGNFTDLLDLPLEFTTSVPPLLGLPDLAENWAEGIVLRPWDYEPPLSKGQGRPLLKRKHARFAEARYHQGKAWHRTGAVDPLDTAESILLAMSADPVRVKSAVSKVGRPVDASDTQRIQELTQELWRDVVDVFTSERGALLLALDAEEQELCWLLAEDAAEQAVNSSYAPSPKALPESRYFTDLAYAFVRGRLGGEHKLDHDLMAAAEAAEIRFHKFKRKDGPPRVTQTLSLLQGIAPSTLLDIGSGRGAFLWPMLARFPDTPVTAIDRLEHRIRDIEAVRVGGIQRLRGIQGDVSQLPFDDDDFDVVTILEVLEHLEDPQAAAREVMRVARRFVIASVPSHEDNNPEHIRLFTEASLRELFVDAGAERVQLSHVRGHRIAVVQ